MMKVITGDKFVTSYGTMILCGDDFPGNTKIAIGEHVLFDGKEYVLRGVIPPSPTVGRMSLCIEET